MNSVNDRKQGHSFHMTAVYHPILYMITIYDKKDRFVDLTDKLTRKVIK
jgi:hypothetical protein